MVPARRIAWLPCLLAACAVGRVEPANENFDDLGDVGSTLDQGDPLAPRIADTDVSDTDPGSVDVRTVAQLASGIDATCVLWDDGSGAGDISCWGSNLLDQATAPEGDDFVELHAADKTFCALDDSGGLTCWGDPTGGRSTPPAGTFESFDGGVGGFCALDSTGGVSCWGGAPAPSEGLPAGSRVAVGITAACLHASTAESVPEAQRGTIQCWGSGPVMAGIPTGTLAVEALDLGSNHGCYLDGDSDTVACWGGNAVGQATAPDASGFRSLSAAYDHACAVRNDGLVSCWGASAAGQSAPPTGSFDVTSTGGLHACAARGDDISCWGRDDSWQATAPITDAIDVSLAMGATGCVLRQGGPVTCFGNARNVPTGDFVAVAPGDRHACAVSDAGRVECWGANEASQVSGKPTGSNFVDVASNRSASCAVDDGGTFQCWGTSLAAQQPVSGGFDLADGGDFHGCAVDQDGEGNVGCWGASGAGQTLPPDGVAFSTLSAGLQLTCGIQTDGAIACFGDTSGGRDQIPRRHVHRGGGGRRSRVRDQLERPAPVLGRRRQRRRRPAQRALRPRRRGHRRHLCHRVQHPAAPLLGTDAPVIGPAELLVLGGLGLAFGGGGLGATLWRRLRLAAMQRAKEAAADRVRDAMDDEMAENLGVAARAVGREDLAAMARKRAASDD